MDISAMEKTRKRTSGVKNTDLLFANLFYDGSEGLFLKQIKKKYDAFFVWIY